MRVRVQNAESIDNSFFFSFFFRCRIFHVKLPFIVSAITTARKRDILTVQVAKNLNTLPFPSFDSATST